MQFSTEFIITAMSLQQLVNIGWEKHCEVLLEIAGIFLELLSKPKAIKFKIHHSFRTI
jgi:hypothetical protein